MPHSTRTSPTNQREHNPVYRTSCKHCCGGGYTSKPPCSSPRNVHLATYPHSCSCTQNGSCDIACSQCCACWNNSSRGAALIIPTSICPLHFTLPAHTFSFYCCRISPPMQVPTTLASSLFASTALSAAGQDYPWEAVTRTHKAHTAAFPAPPPTLLLLWAMGVAAPDAELVPPCRARVLLQVNCYHSPAQHLPVIMTPATHRQPHTNRERTPNHVPNMLRDKC